MGKRNWSIPDVRGRAAHAPEFIPGSSPGSGILIREVYFLKARWDRDSKKINLDRIRRKDKSNG